MGVVVPSLIEDYALPGDLQTAALVDRHGSIDWLCLPRFDSPACFAALLDDEDAGRWLLAPANGAACTRRRYRGETLVLETEWETVDGSVRLLDFMPPRGQAADVVRIVEGLSGSVPMRADLRLRFDYGNLAPWIRCHDGQFVAVAGPDAIWLHTPIPIDERSGRAEFTVHAGQPIPFVLTHAASHLTKPDLVDAGEALRQTESYWRSWIGRCGYDGRWSVDVRRSLILLKALTYAPTGGIVAAATTSLPEQLGGERNWDYRYCWLRDATFTLQALLGTGFVEEAREWREWLVRAVVGDPAKLQIMYGLDGGRRMSEQVLPWLAGYEGAAPVRIGNAAADQFQLDVWGEVLDGPHLARQAGIPVMDTAWDLQRGLLDHLEGHWTEPDNSLWEVRGPRRHFVHSKVMAWAGFDRERGTFTQFYGSSGVDAALLLLPRVGFLPWNDERIVGTVNAVRSHLSHNGLLHRYHTESDGGVDGLSGTEGAFLACSFWLADALHATGRTGEAIDLFERLLDLRNDVGLLSEEYDVHAGRQVGNTPQAFSLVGLINTARALSGAHTTTSR